MVWSLQVGNLNVNFRSTKQGALGVRFTGTKETGHLKYYVPRILGEEEVLPYNPKNPQENFIDRRYYDGKDNYYKVEEVTKKYYEKDKPEVFVSVEEMKKMFPLTKQAKVISKQKIGKLNLKNISAHDGYYLLPEKDYENIQKYRKVIDYLGDDFIITSPIRLRVSSTTEHNYAIFVDKKQNALVAVEVLVKAGLQPEPSVGV